MNARYRQVLICGVVTVLLFSCTQAYAGPVYGDSDKTMEQAQARKENLIKELGLTPEQEKRIKDLQSKQKKERGEVWIKIQDKRLELKEELEKPDIDRAKIDLIVTKLNALMAEKLEQRVQGILSMKEILTPEQYEKFKEKIEAFKDKVKERRKQK